MFAVPGWSVSASALKTQTTKPDTSSKQQHASKRSDGLEDGGDAGQDRGGKNKKRKRKSDVNAKNFVDMFEAVVEGKSNTQGDKPSEVSNKRAKQGQTAGQTHEKARSGSQEDGINERPRHDQEKKSKSKKDKKDKKEKKDHRLSDVSHSQVNGATSRTTIPETITAVSAAPVPQLTPLQASMRAKLISARFRHLNQTLYTTPSANALSLFNQNPEMFDEYHAGFRKQVEVWPENPVDNYMAQILVRGKQRIGRQSGPSELPPLPRTAGACRIADMGCGDAKLSQGLQKAKKKLNLEIHSFDLVSKHPLVTRADIANLPLADGSVDVAIFCLALMGTNWVDFIDEAFRVLRWKGELWVAEIKSRFSRVDGGGRQRVEHSVGKRVKKELEEKQQEQELAVEVDGQDRAQETDVSAFVDVLQRHGFALQSPEKAGGAPIDLSNKMFVKMQFVKASTPVRGKNASTPAGGAGAPTEKDEGAGDGRGGKKKKKFIEVDTKVVDENSVLKPCVYKLR